ncbi:RhuM family protein [Pseudoalteromonas sp. Ld20]|uniref:RhuM family protein n=1 Tax=Pseudoalteromonas sp. Ld20 TaxID=649165 RepID=UPI0038673E27
MSNELEIYQNEDGSLQLAVALQHESLWLSQLQLAQLFNTSTDNISLHLKNIYQSGELDENATTEDYSVVRQEGKRQVKRKLKHYNLDAIISVGYRVNSTQATRFRQWATKTLKQHLLKGYSLNQERLAQNATELDNALQLVKRIAVVPQNSEFGAGLVDIIASYTQTFLWLQKYDEGLLNSPKGELGGALTPLNDAKAAIAQLKQNLIIKGEATKLFAQERDDGLAAIWGALEQTVFGEPAYPSIESKAAHLLYFVVKNHPFSDGNKRTAAFLFVDFLNRNQRLLNEYYQPVINDTGLAAITLLVAESNPKEKDTIIRLIENLLSTD